MIKFNVRKIASLASYWLLSQGLRDQIHSGLTTVFGGRESSQNLPSEETHAPVTSEAPPTPSPPHPNNERLHNRHVGQRCFILCTGPSISLENLSALKGEHCFSVSNFYKHPDFHLIAPLYHCIPNVDASHENQRIVQWFTEINQNIGTAELILGDRQQASVSEFNPFGSRTVHFLSMIKDDSFYARMNDIDLCAELPGVQSVPIMCLMVAIYMGFSEIYLLGVDHNVTFNSEYHHFYDRKVSVLQDPNVDSNGTAKFNRRLGLEYTLNLWKQYEQIKRIAESKGISIVNLSRGSYLDVFPSSTLPAILDSPRSQNPKPGGNSNS